MTPVGWTLSSKQPPVCQTLNDNKFNKEVSVIKHNLFSLLPDEVIHMILSFGWIQVSYSLDDCIKIMEKRRVMSGVHDLIRSMNYRFNADYTLSIPTIDSGDRPRYDEVVSTIVIRDASLYGRQPFILVDPYTLIVHPIMWNTVVPYMRDAYSSLPSETIWSYSPFMSDDTHATLVGDRRIARSVIGRVIFKIPVDFTRKMTSIQRMTITESDGGSDDWHHDDSLRRGAFLDPARYDIDYSRISYVRPSYTEWRQPCRYNQPDVLESTRNFLGLRSMLCANIMSYSHAIDCDCNRRPIHCVVNTEYSMLLNNLTHTYRPTNGINVIHLGNYGYSIAQRNYGGDWRVGWLNFNDPNNPNGDEDDFWII